MGEDRRAVAPARALIQLSAFTGEALARRELRVPVCEERVVLARGELEFWPASSRRCLVRCIVSIGTQRLVLRLLDHVVDDEGVLALRAEHDDLRVGVDPDGYRGRVNRARGTSSSSRKNKRFNPQIGSGGRGGRLPQQLASCPFRKPETRLSRAPRWTRPLTSCPPSDSE